MTYEELKAKINDLPRTRYRAQVVNDLDAASTKAGYKDLFDFVEYHIRIQIALAKSKNGNEIPTVPVEVKRDGLRKYFGLTNGQISGATRDKKLQCTKVGSENIYPTSQPYLRMILENRTNSLLSSGE